jgi:hypothetical protein
LLSGLPPKNGQFVAEMLLLLNTSDEARGGLVPWLLISSNKWPGAGDVLLMLFRFEVFQIDSYADLLRVLRGPCHSVTALHIV